MIRRLEDFIFGARRLILILLAVITVFALYFAAHLRLSTGFDKALPMGHEYIDTFQKYRDQLFGSNSLIVVLEPRTGTIWNRDFFKTYKNLTDDIFYLPGVARESVTSLWTPNVHYIEITEDGATAQDVIPNGVQPDAMTPEDIDAIKIKAIGGGFVGRVVANDFTGAMVWADMQDFDPSTGKKVDLFDVADKLEKQIRHKYENDKYSVRIIGFAKAIGDVADGARSVFIFFAIAFLLTALSLYLYSRSWMLTGATLLASLTSVVWQFAALDLLGYGLDPLAILVPFLVFAIGVSHGVQQINRVTAAISAGASSEHAARASFVALLGPGSMALTTTFIGFATLYLIPIEMIRELAIAAAIGVAFKMVTNLVMLPLLVTYMRFDEGFAHRAAAARRVRLDVMHKLGDFVSSPRNSVIILCIAAVLFTLSIYASRNRHVGALYAGVPELREDSRYNIDSRDIASKFSLGLNILTVAVETPADACVDYDTLNFLNKFSWYMQNVPGVNLVVSLPYSISAINVPFNEGNLRWHTIPKVREALAQEEAVLPGSAAVMNKDCTLLPHLIFLKDARATTIATAVAAVKTYRSEHRMKGVNLRLAAGNMGVQAAVNEEVSRSELPMMLWVYAVVIALVAIVYRDLRAIIACCLPLTFATFLGYWFMDMLQIGLTVATLSVMVLAVGIGVDYAFYIYNRIQYHFTSERDATESVKHAMLETGMATFFTAVTLAIGVSTWAFSPLKFQADMGLLLTFMFLINMVVAVTVLPAIVVVLDLLLPRTWSEKRHKGVMAH
ncbi:MMPL family transporter [Parvibaculum sedimenti]|uniref:MMPL family transporter n=1 Tax=Parvibaculum sedimenti TaxID=2608632 RepID=A0A6N6VDD2_9HYPH|nr:MMPL family transporter [Parvibaculum sedimenti]KAB7738570.1 MMPL family transporter [Parvibaculum sedimenti]